jgi:hypothetical protein
MAGPYGVSTFTANGESWNVTKSTCRASIPKREILPSQTEIGDYSEVPVAGKMTVTVRPKPDQDSSALQNATGLTCTLVERNGVTWYGSGLTQTGDGEYDTAEGTMELVFEGPTVTRATAS